MSFKAKLRSILPPTNRYYEERNGILAEQVDELKGQLAQLGELKEQLAEIKEQNSQLYHDLHYAVHNIHGNIEWGHARTADLSVKLSEIANRSDMQFWQSYRQPQEPLDDAKRRFLTSLPKATGRLREIQEHNAALLAKLFELCAQNNLSIWLAGGTLIGADIYQGFIPWDDDIDTYMEAEQLNELMALLAGNSDYRITLAYDPRAKCKQIRFCATDCTQPYFVDIFPFYYSVLPTTDNTLTFQDCRRSLVADFDAILDSHDFDHEHVNWFYPDSEAGELLSALIEQHIASFAEKLGKSRLAGVDKSKLSLVRGIENIDESWMTSSKLPTYSYEEIFPLSTATFEGVTYAVANDTKWMLANEYDDYLKLPYDILSHYRHIE